MTPPVAIESAGGDAEIIIGELVADELGADVRARIGRARQRGREFDIGAEGGRLVRAGDVVKHVDAEARACRTGWSSPWKPMPAKAPTSSAVLRRGQELDDRIVVDVAAAVEAQPDDRADIEVELARLPGRRRRTDSCRAW